MRQFFPSLLKKQQGNSFAGKAVSPRWLALGIALLDIIAAYSTATLKSSRYTDATALVAGFRWAFAVSAGVAIVGVLVAVFVIDHHLNS